MKQTLLFAFLLFCSTLSYGQIAYAGNTGSHHSSLSVDDIDLKVYPNPATSHIHFNNFSGNVQAVVFFNLVGRPIKRFTAIKGKNHYDLSELSRGLYLVQLMDRKGKVISTKRLNKR